MANAISRASTSVFSQSPTIYPREKWTPVFNQTFDYPWEKWTPVFNQMSDQELNETLNNIPLEEWLPLLNPYKVNRDQLQKWFEHMPYERILTKCEGPKTQAIIKTILGLFLQGDEHVFYHLANSVEKALLVFQKNPTRLPFLFAAYNREDREEILRYGDRDYFCKKIDGMPFVKASLKALPIMEELICTLAEGQQKHLVSKI